MSNVAEKLPFPKSVMLLITAAVSVQINKVLYSYHYCVPCSDSFMYWSIDGADANWRFLLGWGKNFSIGNKKRKNIDCSLTRIQFPLDMFYFPWFTRANQNTLCMCIWVYQSIWAPFSVSVHRFFVLTISKSLSGVSSNVFESQ